MIENQTLKNIATAYSLATLCFIASWKELLFQGRKDYLAFEQRSAVEHLAIFADVVVVTIVSWLLIKFSEDLTKRFGRFCQIGFIGLGFLAFAPLSTEFMKWLTPDSDRLTGLPLPLLVGVTCFFFARKAAGFDLREVAKNTQTAALLILPFCILIVGNSLYALAFPNSALLSPMSIERPPTTDRRPKLSQKIVWIIFDELDYAELKDAIGAGRELPEFKRLLNESFVADNVRSPNRNTMEAIPALLLGRRLAKSETLSADDIELAPADGSESFSFRSSPNVFRDVAQLGGNSGVVGWFHPYPRILQDSDVSFCYASPLVKRRCSENSQLAPCMLGHFARSIKTLPLFNRLVPKSVKTMATEEFVSDVESQVERVAFMNARANELVSRPNLNLLFFHFSVPHLPFLSSKENEEGATYASSLEVADSVLGKLRGTLERNGEWEKTYFLVTSDHSLRESPSAAVMHAGLMDYEPELLEEGYIPFIMKVPNQSQRVDYDREFNSIVTKDLIVDIFKGKVKTAEDVGLWLDSRR